MNLRKIQKQDASLLIKWFNDSLLCQYMDDSEDNKIYDSQDIDSMISSKDSSYYVLEENKKAIGYASLYNLKNFEAEFSFLIGDSTRHSKGLGEKLLYLLMNKAHDLNLNRIYCFISNENIASLKCVLKVGFMENKNIIQKNELMFYKDIV